MTQRLIDLGPFRLDRLSGRGATAIVWRAAHRQRGVPVAVKILAGLAPDDDTARRRFVDEVRAMAALDHRAVIRLHDHGRVPPGLGADLPTGAPYLVMDWHGGGTLRRRQGQLTFRALRRTLSTLLDALGHAHARGVIHRDLKPANVLLGEGGPVVADFGLVFSRAAGIAGGAGGTPNYMAPEQIRGDWRSFGPWTDLYALGCVAWALTTGRAPYAGEGARHAMQRHLTGELPPLKAAMPTPADFEPWLRRLLAREPTARFRFAADAAAALAAMPDAEETQARLVGPAAPSDDPERTIPTEDLTPLVDDMTALTDPLSALDDAPSRRTARPADRPPMPPHWRRPTPPWTAHLPGCGTGLVELRVPPLSGRITIRDRLWDQLADVVHARGARAMIIEGAAGLGKSRVMRWMSERSHESGQADALLVQHAPVPSAVHGIGPIFERHLHLVGLDDTDAILRLSALGIPPDLAARMAAVGRSGPIAHGDDAVTLDSEAALFDAIIDGLGALTGHRPLVIQIDDAQWGLEAVRFVAHVFDRQPQLAVLFVLTLRSASPGDTANDESDARRALDLLGHHPEVEQHRLEPLGPEAHDAVAAARLPLTAETRAILTRSTGGSPLFADEMLRHWLSAGALEETTDGFRLRPDRPDVRPPSLAHLWQARLDALLDDLRPDPLPALEMAAALGTSLDPGEWRTACDAAGVPYPLDALDRLLDHGLMRRADDRLVFDHGLLRDALVDRAHCASRLERWHHACADGLAELGDPDPVRRAAHLAAAGEIEAAIPLWLGAARDRMRRGWHKDIRPAISLFDAVLRHHPDDASALADAALCRARLGWLAAGGDDRRQLDAARDYARRAIAASPESSSSHRAMAMVHHYRGEPLAALRRLEQAIEYDPTDGESRGMAGRVLAETGPLDRAIHHLEQALALGSDTVDLRIELARVHAYRGAWDRVRALLVDPDPRPAQRALADIALARFGLWRGPDAPWSTDPPVAEPSPVAELFRAVSRAGHAQPRHLRWLDERAQRALAGGAGRRAVLFIQSMAELSGFAGDRPATLAAFEAAVDAGLTDRMWAMHCPLLTSIAGSTSHQAGVARIDARLLESDRRSKG